MKRGHAAHTRDAAARGLPGVMPRPLKLTMLGAGSGFTPRLLNDLFRIPGEQGGTIALVDIDPDRLATMRRVVEKLAAQLGKTHWKIVASPDRAEILADSDYVVNCIEVSGTACVRFDNDIPLKYGVDQCIGDTIGPGGLFKALRTIPVWLDVLRDCERLCPRALVLNYTNPMAMLCLAAGRVSSMRVVGLCHSVQGTSHLLAEYAGVPYADLDWDCAGINHLAWFTRLEHRGEDLYPRLHKKFAAELADAERERRAGLTSADATDVKPWIKADMDGLRYRQRDLVRKDMCLHFGAFITESSGHLSEYLPYYRKSAAGRNLLRLGYDGGSRFYATNWPKWRRLADRERAGMLAGRVPMDWARSWEYASWIIEAREKDVPFRIHGNVMNNHGGAGQLITNLPADGCVEVACLVDRNGVSPTRHGALPPQMAALCASNMAVFDLGAQAAIEHSVEKAIHALLLDPLTAALCTPAQIKAMTLELFRAEKRFLPGYK
ncbi:MAG TPA: alpha-glucosidase/alpha-galactosidase [Opitutaceae bacterium]|nr:alpha-glucosidase/alpha-galactosidase [Opitutaceae bacterium]